MDGLSRVGYRPPMDIRTLLYSAVGLMALAAFAGWRGARLPNPHRGPRLVPWRWIMLLAATAAIIAVLQVFAELKGA